MANNTYDRFIDDITVASKPGSLTTTPFKGTKIN